MQLNSEDSLLKELARLCLKKNDIYAKMFKTKNASNLKGKPDEEKIRR